MTRLPWPVALARDLGVLARDPAALARDLEIWGLNRGMDPLQALITTTLPDHAGNWGLNRDMDPLQAPIRRSVWPPAALASALRGGSLDLSRLPVGRGQLEPVEGERRGDGAADQYGPVQWSGRLPRPGRHDGLRALSDVDLGT